MAIDNYVNTPERETENAPERKYTRRDALKGLAGILGLALGGSIASYESRKAYGEEKPIERKKYTLTEQDKYLLTDNTNWGADESLRKEYNSVAEKLITVLNEQGKYNPTKKENYKALIDSKLKQAKTKKQKLEILKKELMIQETPEEYLKLDSKARQYAKGVDYNQIYSDYFNNYKKALDIDVNNLSLSDKIKACVETHPMSTDQARDLSSGIVDHFIDSIGLRRQK